MDTLTHALSGALLARASARRAGTIPLRPLRERIVVGTLAAAFPDSDYLASLVSPLYYLLNHRGLTHSLLVLPLWACLLAWLAGRAFRNPRGWRAYWGIAALGVGMHILGDLITSYGTMIFAPFSDARYAWGTTFIIDLWLSGIILAGLALSLWCKASRIPAIASLAVLVAYVGFQAWLKVQALDVGRMHASSTGRPEARVSVQPGPVSPYNWMVVETLNGEYRYALVNLARSASLPQPDAGSNFFYRLSAAYDPTAQARWQTASLHGNGTDAALVREAWSQPELDFFRWFAEYPALYRVDRHDPSVCVWFYDLRFFRPGTEFLPFRYGMCRDGGGPWRRYQLTGMDERSPL